MVVSNQSIAIKRPMDAVYQYLMNLDNYPVWQSGLVRVSATEGMKVGSLITFTATGLGQTFDFIAEVVENNETDSFHVVSTRGPMTFDSVYTLTRVTDGTKLLLQNSIQTKALFRLAQPVLQSIGDARYQTDLLTLKSVLESEPN